MAKSNGSTAEVPAKTKQKIGRLVNLRKKYGNVLEEIERLEKQIQVETVESETSFIYRNVTVVYSTGYPRDYWDGKGLNEYADEHPEIEEYRKPSVVPPFAYLKIS
jgi:hypothetical protein